MNKKIKLSSFFLALIAIAGFAMYFFPQDPINAPLTFKGLIHLILAGITALSTLVAIYLAAFSTADTLFRRISITLGTIILIFGAMTPVIITKLPNYFGLFERITIGSFILWLLIFSIVLLKNKINF